LQQLGSLNLREAWAGSFEALLHRDLAGVNDRLAAVASRHPALVPIGALNPELPGWERDLQRCRSVHHMAGIRLHPNYHGYRLDDPRVTELLIAATQVGLFVQIAACMEVPDVDLTPLPDLLAGVPQARVQLLNWRPREPLLTRLRESPRLWFDTARTDGTDGIAALLRTTGPERVLHGSHAPFLLPEAALIRLGEAPLTDEHLAAILAGNARRLRELA
jgi:hypothetical protein